MFLMPACDEFKAIFTSKVNPSTPTRSPSQMSVVSMNLRTDRKASTLTAMAPTTLMELVAPADAASMMFRSFLIKIQHANSENCVPRSATNLTLK